MRLPARGGRGAYSESTPRRSTPPKSSPSSPRHGARRPTSHTFEIARTHTISTSDGTHSEFRASSSARPPLSPRRRRRQRWRRGRKAHPHSNGSPTRLPSGDSNRRRNNSAKLRLNPSSSHCRAPTPSLSPSSSASFRRLCDSPSLARCRCCCSSSREIHLLCVRVFDGHFTGVDT